MLQAKLLEQYLDLAANQGRTPEQLQRRADDLRAALALLSVEEEDFGKDFHIYVLWQTR